ncbi:hypothetical protein EJ08DRAFT_75309 [Tothia fuscella]|uniref:Uncharacterized protein n=1 Tax=Tothia fuscella TaxID=1048955 RepID=A0A9P4NX75_9PEZI|nr:hypothetical protein EJ08DRAFT_75309 [Tothia fuscella]
MVATPDLSDSSIEVISFHVDPGLPATTMSSSTTAIPIAESTTEEAIKPQTIAFIDMPAETREDVYKYAVLDMEMQIARGFALRRDDKTPDHLFISKDFIFPPDISHDLKIFSAWLGFLRASCKSLPNILYPLLFHPPIMLASRRTRDEAYETFLKSSTFCLEEVGLARYMQRWLRSIPDSFKWIRIIYLPEMRLMQRHRMLFILKACPRLSHLQMAFNTNELCSFVDGKLDKEKTTTGEAFAIE